MSPCFLIVLPNEIRSGLAPAARHWSISRAEAASKLDPSPVSNERISAAGLALTA